MNVRLPAPIGILDEHPEWSARLIVERGRDDAKHRLLELLGVES